MIWLQYFVDSIEPMPKNPFLLILDNHNSHVSLPYCKFCRENGIVVISVPPHVSQTSALGCHILWATKICISQGMWFDYKDQEYDMSSFDVDSVFNKVYSRVALVENISGFKVTGIYLLNPHTFSVEGFVVPAVLFLLQRSHILLTNNRRHWASATGICWLQVNYSAAGTQKFLVLIPHTALPDF